MSQGSSSQTDLESELALLRWYLDSGIDTLLEEAPIDRTATQPAQAAPVPERPRQSPAAQPRPLPIPTQGTAANGNGVADAKSLAAACSTLAELKTAVESFDGCALKATATNTVFADGNPEAPVMFIGEAPGRDEDLKGLPFVGAAGQLLDKMMAAIGRDRSGAYISNILNWRPPGNRTPTVNEAMTCLPFIKRHIQLTRPKIIVLLGGTAAKHLLDTNQGIMRMRGKWTEVMLDDFGEDVVPALPTLHPAYLLRQPAHKRLAWQDFLKIQERLQDS